MDKYLLTIPRRIDRPLFGKNRGLARSVPRSVVDLHLYIYIFRYISIRLFGSILLANRGRSIETRHYIRKIFFEKSATTRDRVSRIHKIFRSFSTLFPSPPPPPTLCIVPTFVDRAVVSLFSFPRRLPPLLRSDSVAERSLETRTIKSFSFTSESTIPLPSYISPSLLVYASRSFSRAISPFSLSLLCQEHAMVERYKEPTSKLIDRIAMTRRGEKKRQERSFDKQIGWGSGERK